MRELHLVVSGFFVFMAVTSDPEWLVGLYLALAVANFGYFLIKMVRPQ